jgi:hypothetical protein
VPPFTLGSQYWPSGQSMKSVHEVTGVKHAPDAHTCVDPQQISAPSALEQRTSVGSQAM